jgi:hypothetical protein
MPVTINVNNLTLCHKGSNGISTATIPDVCKTPSPGGPVPIPYPNVAMSMDLMKGTTTVQSDGGMMCANYGSEFFKSTGDEPGVAGGVVSSTFIKEATWITFSFDVKLQGKGACRLTDKMFHNHMNTVNMAGLIQVFLRIVAAVGGFLLKRGGKEVAKCEAIHQGYKQLNCKGCKDATTVAEATSRSACLTAEIAGRKKFLDEKCDYKLPGSIARGSQQAERGHRIQLTAKINAAAGCAAKIAKLSME